MPAPLTWTIGDVEFPFSPSQINDENESVTESFDLDGVAAGIFATAQGVRVVQISGSIALEGLDKAAIEAAYSAPLRAYQGTSQTVESPSGAYDGDWLVKKVSFKEQAEGASLSRIIYSITLWKPSVLVVL
jgi:hypothetical protein